MANETRSPRTAETRHAEAREHEQRNWTPPSLLPEPKPHPDYTFRWIRVASRGQADSVNLSKALREGYEPVPVEEQPEMAILAVKDPASRFDGCIENGGLILCKFPKKFAKQRIDYYSNQNKQVESSMDNDYLRDQVSSMPKFSERKTKVSFSSEV